MKARRNRMLVRKLKKKRKTRIIGLTSTMVLLLFMMTYFALKMLNKVNQKPESIVANMTNVEETPAVETKFENNDTKDEVEKPKPETLGREYVTGFENISFSLTTTAPRKIDFDVLLKGSSYSIRASRYAYDTNEVKGWMKGTTAYQGPKIAFLTFDDGPGKYTVAILDILKEKKTPATFFILGRSLAKESDQSILQRYIREGHAIANHSYSHEYSYMYPERIADTGRILEEYQKNLSLMKGILGDDFNTTVFRYPGGSGSWNNIEASKTSLAGLGVK